MPMTASWRYAVHEMTNPKDFISAHNDPMRANFEIVAVYPVKMQDGQPVLFGVVVKNLNPTP